jgi:predicted outer membrane protein
MPVEGTTFVVLDYLIVTAHPLSRRSRGLPIALCKRQRGQLRPDGEDAMTTPLTRSATAIAIVLMGWNLSDSILAGQARRTDSRLFINDLTVVGLTEVRLGEMAGERGQRDSVKAFGQMMVKDHTAANAELSQLAAEMKIVPPTEIDKKHGELVDRLSKLSGAEFDRAYIMAMVDGHQAVAAQLREWTTESRPLGPPPAGDPKAADLARGGADEEKLTRWAMKTLPTVEKHLEHARALQKGE